MRAALLTGAVLALGWLALPWMGRDWVPWNERPLRDEAESATAARALAGCYAGQAGWKPHPRWVPLWAVPAAPDGSRDRRRIFWLDAEREPASVSRVRSHWIPTYQLRDETGAEETHSWWWTPVGGGGFLIGTRSDYGPSEEGVVHPAGRGRDGAPEFDGRWAVRGGSHYKLVLRRVPCPRLPG